jgi:hypothetical protein
MEMTISRRGDTETVPTETLNQWLIRKQHGDIEALSEKYNISRDVFTRAFNKGKAQPVVIKLINQYYGIAA